MTRRHGVNWVDKWPEIDGQAVHQGFLALIVHGLLTYESWVISHGLWVVNSSRLVISHYLWVVAYDSSNEVHWFIIYLKHSIYVCWASKTRVRQKDCSNKKVQPFRPFMGWFYQCGRFFAIFDLIGFGGGCWRRYILVTESLCWRQHKDYMTIV